MTRHAPLGVAIAAGVAAAATLLAGCGRHPGRDTCELGGTPPATPQPQILFGDLHAHSVSSLDALVQSLPLTGGTADRGPAERCLFARYCAQLDFWNLADHPEEQLASHWRESLEEVRHCNDRFAGYEHEPRMVTFMGWEWTRNSATVTDDFGHRNIVLKHTCAGQVPARPIAAPSGFADVDVATIQLFGDLAIALDPANEAVYRATVDWVVAYGSKPACPTGVDSRELPADCHEVARDPVELFAKLDEWGVEALVIPHGLTWGVYHAPPGSWRQQLGTRYHDPRYGQLLEVYSGHGNGEPYRPWRAAVEGADGRLTCPEPWPDFEPCCHRAGELVRTRSESCQAEPAGQACADEVAAACQAFVDAGLDGQKTLSWAGVDDWLDCDQCRDCFQPALGHQPGFSAQAALASTSFDEPDEPWRTPFGLLASTDSHRSGPGAGYKDFREMSDAFGAARAEVEFLVKQAGALVVRDPDRQNSYFYAGGLVAVHAVGRSRLDIWEALMARRVYATSGDRIELWFDLTNGPDGVAVPMGSSVALAAEPSFSVRAVGAPVQSPGCPAWVAEEAPAGVVEGLCFGECYHPSDTRHLITRIEVVRIRPQVAPDEPLEGLIEDPFLTLPCPSDPSGCTVTFADPEYLAAGRPASYYVRAIQEPTLQYNAANLRCTRDADGSCVAVDPCRNGFDATDDCRALDEERAWSSPVFLRP
jgi:hypothetical protein